MSSDKGSRDGSPRSPRGAPHAKTAQNNFFEEGKQTGKRPSKTQGQTMTIDQPGQWNS